MQLDRSLLVSMLLVGALSHYTPDEIQKYKEINNILMKIQKRNFVLKNGTPQQRLLRNDGYVLGEMKKQPKRKEKIISQVAKEVKAHMKRIESWETHAKIADAAWQRAANSFSANNEITVNQLVMAIIRKDDTVMKAYKFNKKILDKFSETGVKGHFFASSRTATKILECLDEEIAHYNYNLETA